MNDKNYVPLPNIKTKDDVINTLFYILNNETNPDGWRNGNEFQGIDEGVEHAKQTIQELEENYINILRQDFLKSEQSSVHVKTPNKVKQIQIRSYGKSSLQALIEELQIMATEEKDIHIIKIIQSESFACSVEGNIPIITFSIWYSVKQEAV